MKTIGKVDILGTPYMVKLGYDNSLEDFYGLIRYSEHTIFINDRACLCKEQREETLLHEVIHGVDKKLKVDLTEEDVQRLGAGLYASGVRVHMEAVK